MKSSYRQINEQYTAWLDTLGFSNGMIYDYNYRVRDFLEWLEMQSVNHTEAVNRINQLTQKHITQYFEYLQNRPNKRYKGKLLSVSHLNHNFIAIDKLLEFLHGQGMKNLPVPTGYRLHVDKDERIRNLEPFTKEEIKILYNAIENTYPKFDFKKREIKHYQLKLIFTLYYACGLRLSEGLRLRLQDIDFERRTVFVEKGKNYKDRFVPMSAGVYRNLQDYIYNFRNKLKTPHTKLFVQDKTGLSNSIKHLQSVCGDEKVKQKRLSMHILRHSIATHLLQNGMSIENISLFLGHSSLESTQIYTHLIDKY